MARRGLGAVLAMALLAVMAGSAYAQGSCMDQALKAHNELRARHGAGPLVWDAALEQRERNWVTGLVNNQNCAMVHSPGGMENLSWNSKDLDNACKMAVDGWYAEKAWYKFDPQTPLQATRNFANRPAPFSIMTGHFTQVVWAAATKVGCYAAQGRCGVVVGCAYDAGNNWSEANYLVNVKPELPNAVASGTGNCPSDVLSTLNTQRNTYGAAPLAWDEGLAAAAKVSAFNQVNQFQCTRMALSNEPLTTVYTLPLPEDRRDVCVHAANQWFGEKKNIQSAQPQGQDSPSQWQWRSSFPIVANRDATKVGCYVHRGPLDCAVVVCKFALAVPMTDANVPQTVMMQPTSNVVGPSQPRFTQDKDNICPQQSQWCDNNGMRQVNGGPMESMAEVCPVTCAAVFAQKMQRLISQAANLGPSTQDNIFNGVVNLPTAVPTNPTQPNPSRPSRVRAPESYTRPAYTKFDTEVDLNGALQDCQTAEDTQCEEAGGIAYPICRPGFSASAPNWAQCTRQSTAANRRMKL